MTEVLLFLLLVFLMIGLTLTVLADEYIRREHKRIMLVIIALVGSLIARDYLGFRFDESANVPGRTLASIYGYSVRPVILILYCNLTSRKDSRVAWILAGLNAAIHCTALFSDICFTISPENSFYRGPLGYSSHVLSALLLARLMYLSVAEYGKRKPLEMFIPLFNALVIIAAVVADTFFLDRQSRLAWTEAAMVLCSIFYYIWLHLQLVRRHEEILRENQRMRIMIAQIQPHFLYNTLSTIQAMCATEPEEAPRIVERFSRYLRQNMDSLNDADLIPVEKEIEHTRIYAEIEMAMYGNVRVEFAVEDAEFSVPALTVQPLVENAIRHGVRAREAGLVTVTARRAPGGHEIVILDNGRGFDPDRAPAGGGHIGIENVRERLQRLCGGTLEIASAPGAGTRATIRVPDATPENRAALLAGIRGKAKR